MDKSPEAFRTISEVAESLETPAHVLRFWESRFPQIRPVKRAGGRRYYRPADVALLTGIKRLLHDEGLTIRGVQKILREQGVRHVAGLAGASEADLAPFDPGLALEEAMAERFGADHAEPEPPAEVETAQIFALESALRRAGPVEKPATPDLFDLIAPSDPESVEEPENGEGAIAEVDPAEVAAIESEGPEVDQAEVAEVEVTESEVTEVALPEVEILVADTPQPDQLPPVDIAHVSAALTVSRAAALRALPVPLPDDLRAAVLPLRDRIAAHRDRLVEAARAGGHRA